MYILSLFAFLNERNPFYVPKREINMAESFDKCDSHEPIATDRDINFAVGAIEFQIQDQPSGDSLPASASGIVAPSTVENSPHFPASVTSPATTNACTVEISRTGIKVKIAKYLLIAVLGAFISGITVWVSK